MLNHYRNNLSCSNSGDWSGLLETLFTPVLTGVLFYPEKNLKDRNKNSGKTKEVA